MAREPTGRRAPRRRQGGATRLATAALAAGLAGLVPQASARATADEQDHPAPPPRAGASHQMNGAPFTSRGAQVLPLTPPDPSTAPGQERGNAALKSNDPPAKRSGGDRAEGDAPRQK